MKHSKIKPLFDNVLVKPVEEEEKTSSGIVLPETATKEKPQTGIIMAVGPGIIDSKGKKIKMVVKKGDRVVYKKWGGNDIKVNGEEWQLMEQKDILAIVG